MRSLDIRSMIQPFSYLIVSNAFKEIPTGETLEILMSGPNDAADLLKILPAASYVMVPMEEQKGADAGFRLQLKKIVIRQDGTGISPTGNVTQ
jgi:TusA-related sulfurtransferase